LVSLKQHFHGPLHRARTARAEYRVAAIDVDVDPIFPNEALRTRREPKGHLYTSHLCHPF
jgi:hypothetical protein